MVKYDSIHITFLIQDDGLYENLIIELEKIGQDFKILRYFNLQDWNINLNENLPEILITDYNPDTKLGLDAVDFFKTKSPSTKIITYVSRDHVPQAIASLQKGVEDYITHSVPSKIYTAVQKILERIHSQRNLLDQQQIMRRIEKKNIALLNAQPDFMLQVSRDGIILDYKPSEESKALNELFKGKELQGRDLKEFFNIAVTEDMIRFINQVMDSGKPQDYEFKILCQGVSHKMEARFVRITHLECLLIIREFQGDNEREEEYYRAISRISRYRHKEDLVKELLNHMVDSDKNLLAEEKKKADLLLSNILPSYMIEDLKKSGKVQPVQYDNAAVMFTDFVGFSKISKYMSPTQLLKELTIYFDEFERICEFYGIEKVKTIGDSFLCVSGLGKNQRTAIVDIILAGIEMARFTQERMESLQKSGEDGWGIRIAIHSGALIAGVVGHKKIAFDIWGHTVNMASRIETVAEGGKITVSRSIYDGARDYFDFDFAGEKELKGVGNHELYTLIGLKKGLFQSKSGNQLIPNKNFYKLYEAMNLGKHILYTEGKYRVSGTVKFPGSESKSKSSGKELSLAK
ncbi:MAG: hypothetical protein JJT78_13525 [Leptospira sp.]|nr:hypothetical protein [Leptospira sp.]